MQDIGARRLAAAVLLQAIKDLTNSYRIVRGGKPVKHMGMANARYMEQMRRYNEAQNFIYELEKFFRSGEFSLYADAIDFNVDGMTIIKRCRLGGYRMRSVLRKF